MRISRVCIDQIYGSYPQIKNRIPSRVPAYQNSQEVVGFCDFLVKPPHIGGGLVGVDVSFRSFLCAIEKDMNNITNITYSYNKKVTATTTKSHSCCYNTDFTEQLHYSFTIFVKSDQFSTLNARISRMSISKAIANIDHNAKKNRLWPKKILPNLSLMEITTPRNGLCSTSITSPSTQSG